MSGRFWEDQPLETLDRAQWEALCDGCGKCCLHKLEDEDTGEVLRTNVACRLLDRRSGRCSNYRHRHAHVPDCIRLTPKTLTTIEWLPESCAYVRRANNLPLPEWHHLNTGDPESIHRAGASVRGWTISEVDAGDLEYHIIEPDD
ncbi:MAG: hypothetical protein RIS52_1096 [Pseudomonadota bacterium]|jgi:uncharacterized protein